MTYHVHYTMNHRDCRVHAKQPPCSEGQPRVRQLQSGLEGHRKRVVDASLDANLWLGVGWAPLTRAALRCRLFACRGCCAKPAGWISAPTPQNRQAVPALCSPTRPVRLNQRVSHAASARQLLGATAYDLVRDGRWVR